MPELPPKQQAIRSPLGPIINQASRDNASPLQSVMGENTDSCVDGKFSDVFASPGRQGENTSTSQPSSSRASAELTSQDSNMEFDAEDQDASRSVEETSSRSAKTESSSVDGDASRSSSEPPSHNAKMEPDSRSRDTSLNTVAKTPDISYPGPSVAAPPSSKVQDPYQNVRFLAYLDHYNEVNKGNIGQFSLQYILDMAWDSWLNTAPKDRHTYYKLAEKRMSELPSQPSDDQAEKQWSNEKPVLVEGEGRIEEDGQYIKPELDFKDQFIDDEAEMQDTEPSAPQLPSFQLQEFTANVTLEILEASVERGVEYLNDLKRPLKEKESISPDAQQWLQQIETLQKQATKTKTVIGVVGNTVRSCSK